MDKQDFISAIKCTRAGWFSCNNRATPSDEIIFHMDQGKEVGTLAREYFPARKTIRSTSENASGTGVHFEKEFSWDGFKARADILLKLRNDKITLIEVKASKPQKSGGNPVKEEYIDDIAYTNMVMKHCGTEADNILIMLLNRDYRKGSPDSGLFCTLDVKERVKKRTMEFEQSLDEIKRSFYEEPESFLAPKCKQCDYFRDCIGKLPRDHILMLSGIRDKAFKELIATVGSERSAILGNIPPDYSLSDLHERIRNAARRGSDTVDLIHLGEELSSIRWPAFYLDFETLNVAIPMYNGNYPYEQVLTQYSIHKVDSSSREVDYKAYLAADPTKDCRRELAEKLIADLNGDGSIIVYANFEKLRIQELVQMFPDLSTELEKIRKRLVDLEKIIKESYYHLDFRGSFSIKSVLPALVPDLSYDDLEIKNGTIAVREFLKMARNECTAQEQERIRNNLLDYCKRDTKAMVEVHKVLSKLIDSAGGIS